MVAWTWKKAHGKDPSEDSVSYLADVKYALAMVFARTMRRMLANEVKENPMEIVRFEMNVPQELVLKFAEGVMKQGRFGYQVMYSLADDRLMYVPRFVASRISALEIQPGEPFTVCKREVKNGQRKSIEWRVTRVEPETQLERDLRKSVEMANARNSGEGPVAVPSAPQLPEALTPAAEGAVVPVANGSGNGNGTVSETAPNGNGPSSIAAPNGTGPTSAPAPNGNSSSVPMTKLEHALKTAISAAYNAEKYGAELGYVVRFDADAIKSMAITVLINMSEGGRR